MSERMRSPGLGWAVQLSRREVTSLLIGHCAKREKRTPMGRAGKTWTHTMAAVLRYHR
jgi:hypothetical protein